MPTNKIGRVYIPYNLYEYSRIRTLRKSHNHSSMRNINNGNDLNKLNENVNIDIHSELSHHYDNDSFMEGSESKQENDDILESNAIDVSNSQIEINSSKDYNSDATSNGRVDLSAHDQDGDLDPFDSNSHSDNVSRSSKPITSSIKSLIGTVENLSNLGGSRGTKSYYSSSNIGGNDMEEYDFEDCEPTESYHYNLEMNFEDNPMYFDESSSRGSTQRQSVSPNQSNNDGTKNRKRKHSSKNSTVSTKKQNGHSNYRDNNSVTVDMMRGGGKQTLQTIQQQNRQKALPNDSISSDDHNAVPKKSPYAKLSAG